ncbi:hypothetical protein AAFA46_07665 [Oscillospiraceae bacterium WX1]
MNKNNINWADNRVFNPAQAKPYNDAPPIRPYINNMNPANTGLSPAAMPEPTPKNPNMGISPAYQDSNTPSMTGLSPTAYQDPSSMAMPYGDMPAQQAPARQNTTTRDDAYATDPFFNVQGPPSVMSPGYIPNYLKSQIGKRVRAEFVFSSLYLDKTGILREVGVNYFVLEDNATHAMIMCDLYSARFVTSV